MSEARFVPLPPRYDPKDTPEDAARRFYEVMQSRRSIRAFSDRPVSRETVEWIVRAASTAPSGANKQPWRFVCIEDPATKHHIREAAEAEERAFYSERVSDAWRRDLEPLGTDEVKEYLDFAPWLIVVFRLVRADDGSQVYYPQESVGIATGLLLAAAHYAGLCTLTHTPNPMGFLARVLNRPTNERPYLLIPLGYPADSCEVPVHALQKKPLNEVMVIV